MKRFVASFFFLLLCSCSSVYYATWEKLGKDKRDLLKDYVVKAREDQKETAAEFKDALTKLREAYPLQHTNLEKNYDSLKIKYEDAVSSADALKKRIDNLNEIASDLFAEWKREAGEITNVRLRESSLAQREEAMEKYKVMKAALYRSYRAVEPVKIQFHDYLLALKHHLNAEALGALEGESSDIQAGIQELIVQMNQSIEETENFIRTLK